MKKLSVIGSGTIVPEKFIAPVGSIWVGSKCGMPDCITPENLSRLEDDTITPFGKAFYKRQASYFVYPLPLVVAYSLTWECTCGILKAFPFLLLLYITSFEYDLSKNDVNDSEILRFMVHFGLAVFCVYNMTILAIDIISKWFIIGHRKAGSYNWDESSYCQRWQLYLTFQSIRNANTLNLLSGSFYLVMYFRALGCMFIPKWR